MKAFFVASSLVLGCSSDVGSLVTMEADAADVAMTGGAPSGTGGARATGGRRTGSGGRGQAIQTGGISSTGGSMDSGGAPASTGGATAIDAGQHDATAAVDGAQGGSTSDATTAPDAAPAQDATACECSSGPCCDGCSFLPETAKCAREIPGPDFWCSPGGSQTCFLSQFILHNSHAVYCSGASAQCDGRTEIDGSHQESCGPNAYCHGATRPGGPMPYCGPCSQD